MQHDTAQSATQTLALQLGVTQQRTTWRRSAGRLVLAVTLALLGACGSDAPTLTGTWTGTITDNLAGTGSVLFTITETGNELTGTWQITFADPTNNNSGTLSGTIGGDAIALTLTAAQRQACSFTVAATRNDDHNFTGTYTASNCTRVETGSLDVSRQ